MELHYTGNHEKDKSINAVLLFFIVISQFISAFAHPKWFAYFSILDGGFAAAAVLISLGGVLGKLNPFQLLVMSIIEAAMFVLNSYVGYSVLGVIDVGKTYTLLSPYKIGCMMYF